MRTSQVGDRVRIHYAKTFQDGTVQSSRTEGRPVEMTIGSADRRLPGLGLGLVGLSEGQAVALDVAAENAYGLPDPQRIKRVTRARFAAELEPGRRVRMRLSGGRTRTVGVVEVQGDTVLIDLNHPRCGQSVRIEVELVAILEPAPGSEHWGP